MNVLPLTTPSASRGVCVCTCVSSVVLRWVQFVDLTAGRLKLAPLSACTPWKLVNAANQGHFLVVSGENLVKVCLPAHHRP